MRFSRLKWRSLFGETLTVCFGVLIALLANEWRATVKIRGQASVALEAVHREVQRNRDLTQTKWNYYQGITAELESLIKSGQGTNIAFEETLIPSWKGISPPLFLNAAHRTAIASEAWSSVSFEQAEAYAAVYGMQDFFMMGIRKYLDSFMRRDQITIRDLHRIFADLSIMAAETFQVQEQALAVEPSPP